MGHWCAVVSRAADCSCCARWRLWLEKRKCCYACLVSRPVAARKRNGFRISNWNARWMRRRISCAVEEHDFLRGLDIWQNSRGDDHSRRIDISRALATIHLRSSNARRGYGVGTRWRDVFRDWWSRYAKWFVLCEGRKICGDHGCGCNTSKRIARCCVQSTSSSSPFI